MNLSSLRSLLENMHGDNGKNDGIQISPWIEVNNVNNMLEKISRKAENAIVFHMGTEDFKEAKFPIIDSLVRLPFQTVCFEGDAFIGEDAVKIVVYSDSTENGFFLAPFVKSKSSNWEFIGAAFKDYSSPDWAIPDIIFKESCKQGTIQYDACLDSMLFVSHWVSLFLTVLNCSNVNTVENVPDQKLQNSRSKKGKKPLFSCWTLNIDLMRNEKRHSGGGTHSSPRLHLRRGHARQYQPGLWTWVNPHVVGDKSSGIIHKDYAVRRAA